MYKNNVVIEKLLINRGLSEPVEREEFFSFKPKKTYDPFLLLNMKAGVDLILDSIKEKEAICIYGDYDADGITSAAVMETILINLGANVTTYIPSRIEEGYGLNKKALEDIKSRGFDLIITVDCGSVSYEEVEYAKNIGLKVLVTDHHNIDGKQADCLIINPKQQNCKYPFKDLAGCGVAFKVAQALVNECEIPKNELNKVLDLVAIGTVGDVVPLLDENRTLVKYGLNILNQKKRVGTNGLISLIYPKGKTISSEDIAFGIVPHINASGRMAHGILAHKLLLTNSYEEAKDLSLELLSLNKERKEIQNENYEECMQIIEKNSFEEDIKIVFSDKVYEGVAGIIAGKIKDELQRPVIIITPSENGLIKGTSRSIKTINIYNVLNQCNEFFESFGGHEGACGFSLKKENLEVFTKKVISIIDNMLLSNHTLFDNIIKEEANLEMEDLNIDLARDILKFNPFGHKNPKPLLSIDIDNVKEVKQLGEDGSHLKFKASLEGNFFIQCILFNKANKYMDILNKAGSKKLIGTLEINTWLQKENLQFVVQEVG